MADQAHKDFGPIADDYSFFERHATEADADARAYAPRLGDVSAGGGMIRMLDFGCGSGTFTERIVGGGQWAVGSEEEGRGAGGGFGALSRDRLRLTLVEPVEAVRREAVERLAGFSAAPIVDSATLPVDLVGW